VVEARASAAIAGSLPKGCTTLVIPEWQQRMRTAQPGRATSRGYRRQQQAGERPLYTFICTRRRRQRSFLLQSTHLDTKPSPCGWHGSRTHHSSRGRPATSAPNKASNDHNPSTLFLFCVTLTLYIWACVCSLFPNF